MQSIQFFTVLFLLSTFPLLAQTTDPVYQEEAAVLETESGRIHGTLMIPVGVEKPPVVLFHAGSGPTDRSKLAYWRRLLVL